MFTSFYVQWFGASHGVLEHHVMIWTVHFEHMTLLNEKREGGGIGISLVILYK